MTGLRLSAMQYLILSALLFLGNTLVSEASEVTEPVLWKAPPDHSASEESPSLNVSKKPILQPKESVPVLGKYVLVDPQAGKCARASLGVEFIVIDNKKKSFFNIDPRSTRAEGSCGAVKCVLSLVFDGGKLTFTFVKDGSVSYVSELKASLEPKPSCKTCKSKTYSGVMDHEKLFSVNSNQSFTCKSGTYLILSESLRIKLVPLQIQAFNLPTGTFGKGAECWADYNKRILPIILGAVAVGLILISVLIFVLTRDRHGGYEPL
ncbi:lysosome-associated membrane glycoprotein 3 [Astyanax mexicanus]|uniref:Lysosomal associated membrane protein 3 n=1 Tax=Astyanax mexicanus TaxID=7994 RepID=A0A8B9KZG1_ASTMX|nr:lysosome-associated membrane glycoprotein 3 [Astyanax mexicanus]